MEILDAWCASDMIVILFRAIVIVLIKDGGAARGHKHAASEELHACGNGLADSK